MVRSKVSKSWIDAYFRDEILPPDIGSDISFTSGHTLFKQTERMAQDPKWYSGNVEFPLRPKSEFRYGSILHCIQYLLRQRPLVNNMLWDPIEVFNCGGERIYSEINTGSWWWEEQVLICIYILEVSASIKKAETIIPVGYTLILVLVASDQTHLTNYSGDKKLWPVYISIGNIHSTIWNKSSMNAWIPLAFLPIPPKRLGGVVSYTVEQQELDALQVIHEMISRILSPLSDAASPQGIEMVCCNEKVRRCVPRLTCWLADHMENATLHCVATNRCPSCITPVGEFGEIPNQAYNFRPHLQEYGILPHSRTYYCLLFSLYHMFIVFVISY